MLHLIAQSMGEHVSILSVTCPGLLIIIIGSALIQDTNVLYYPMFDKDQTCEWSKISVETLSI